MGRACFAPQAFLLLTLAMFAMESSKRLLMGHSNSQRHGILMRQAQQVCSC